MSESSEIRSTRSIFTDALGLSACVLLSFSAGSISFLFGTVPGEWYGQLTKPPLTPPGSVFGIVWPILYLLIGIALYGFLITVRDSSWFWLGVSLFALQWGLNATWTPVFFELQSPECALGILFSLVFMNIALTVCFWAVNRWSGILLVPYFVWTLFALYLNLGIVYLNTPISSYLLS